MPLCFRIFYVSQNFGHVFYIVKTEHIMPYIIFVLISPYALRKTGQNEVSVSIQVLSYALLLLLYKIYKGHVANRAKKGHFFDGLAHYSPYFFARSIRRSRIKHLQDIIFFDVSSNYSKPCFLSAPRQCSSLYRCLQGLRALLLRLDCSIPSFGLACQVA